MNLYKRMYLVLFNAITDALEELNAGRRENAAELLKTAQITAEEVYIAKTVSKTPWKIKYKYLKSGGKMIK